MITVTDQAKKQALRLMEDEGKDGFFIRVGVSGGLNGKGFVFNNPNADRTCGCGESFSV